MLTSALFILGACTNTKNKESAESHYQANGDAVYPAIDGVIPYAVTLTDKGDDETNYKVQLTVGKMMEVDCNQHNLEGDFKNETLEGFGYDYYVFETNGNVASTMMACPDNIEDEFKKILYTTDNLSTDGQTLSLNKARMAPLARFVLVK